MYPDLENQGHIIVGGSSGIGLATAEILAANKARVAIISRDEATSLAAELSKKYNTLVTSIVGDATAKSSIENAIQCAAEELEDIKGLVTCNAERPRHTSDFLDSSDDDWQASFDSLVMGTVRCCRAVIPYLKDSSGGSIVTLGAYSIRSPKPYLFPYAASKAAIANLTKNLAKCYGDRGIRANCVCPGVTETGRSQTRLDDLTATRGISREEAAKVTIENLGMSVALKRLGKPSEVAEAIAFLLSEKSSYISGALLNIDGGTDF
jgi:NAD(P)-dependent dehydrogenase (short-subunit alcohol dehydrogenase family)